MRRDFEADIVIVGASSAGCLLANQLSADPSLQVLLIEAGGVDANNVLVAISLNFRQFIDSTLSICS